MWAELLNAGLEELEIFLGQECAELLAGTIKMLKTTFHVTRICRKLFSLGKNCSGFDSYLLFVVTSNLYNPTFKGLSLILTLFTCAMAAVINKGYKSTKVQWLSRQSTLQTAVTGGQWALKRRNPMKIVWFMEFWSMTPKASLHLTYPSSENCWSS